MNLQPVKVGLIGCGNISARYLETAKRFRALDVVACADVLADRAREKAGAFGIPRVCTVEELLRDEEIELVLNLTVPKAH
ncbi:MAG: Gfo/Idh/MocA family oxidoreductase, partial [Planctomycetota bacterium]